MPTSNHDHANFATTHWSLVVSAGRDSTQSRVALAALCETYWYPLYAFVRRKGHQVAEAQDLTQAFFAELLEKDRLQAADQNRGRFRSFLLTSLNNFLKNEWRDANAQKRGGGRVPIQLDFADGEERYGLEPVDEVTAERIFERRWAMMTLDRAMNRLREEFEESGKSATFERLKDFLGGATDGVPYREVAEELDMTEVAVKVAVHRMRKRCRNLIRSEIAQTVAEPSDVDDELKHLFESLGA